MVAISLITATPFGIVIVTFANEGDPVPVDEVAIPATAGDETADCHDGGADTAINEADNGAILPLPCDAAANDGDDNHCCARCNCRRWGAPARCASKFSRDVDGT
jgi:hypothetical protein